MDIFVGGLSSYSNEKKLRHSSSISVWRHHGVSVEVGLYRQVGPARIGSA